MTKPVVLNSSRKFGVEVEFFAPSKENLRKLVSRLPITDDGSIRHIKYAGEYVSPVLQGSKGEKKLRDHCQRLKENGASSDNEAMSIHIHLDARLKSEMTETKRRPKEVECVAFSTRMRKDLPHHIIKDIVYSGGQFDNPLGTRTVIDNVKYYSKAPIKRHPLANYTYYYIDREERTEWVKKVLYFYTQYSDVMEAIVSNSRRFGNMYCIPLGKSYELEEIEACRTMKDLKRLWYKGRPAGGKYDDSRYHNVNLHCLWNRTGTIEFRSHGGTTDPDKILLWLRLHQGILDKLEEVDINSIKLNGKDPYHSFVDFLDDPVSKEYTKRLLGFFSGIKLT